MRLYLRFIIPLALTLGLMAFAVFPLVDTLTFKWSVRDIDTRAQAISNALQPSLLPILMADSSGKKMPALFNRVIEDERLYALAFCDPQRRLLYRTPMFPVDLTCRDSSPSHVLQLPQGPLHVAFLPIKNSGENLGQLVLVHDMSFMQKRRADTKTYVVYLFVALGAVILFLTVLIAQMSWRSWIKGLRTILKDLERDRRKRDENQISWSPHALRDILQNELAGAEVLVVSNREPYIHVKKNEKIEIQFPASGLVTALEPIMRACSGVWVAHGGGSADREVVDKYNRVKVPPENPAYQIRRIWLTKEEEQGYYYGFANEGIWALCHIAHVRPVFRSQDWAHYVAVNQKFADALAEEARTEDPVILVQDYHFALLPKMIRQKIPKATVITFWHIPFPNPEVFGICPWREELLDGLLGSSILGFHTRFHCNNFTDTVDRFIESRIDRETSTIFYKGSLTAVNHYPISIEHPVKWLNAQHSIEDCRRHVRQINGLPLYHLLGVGVDRLDYTKGILERFLAVERLLEIEPQWIGRFTFIQIAAPSRSTIEQYRNFEIEVRALAERINTRFGTENNQPIRLRIEHHEPRQVYEYYRGADLCFVSSLHDGMNLVAKEFVAARDDELGVLILSQFTGAARELPEALIVNPYDIDHCARALHTALQMPEQEQRERIRGMRGMIKEFNVYRWAGRMLLDASQLRQRTRLFDQINESRFDKLRLIS